MHRTTSKQRQIVRRILIYALMVTSVVALVTALVLLMLGYRFDRDNNSLQQGGLVQFISRPTGAKITIGKAKLANDTPTKITVNPGEYNTTMSKDGYRTWQKTVTVLAGQVLWLNYAQLVPNTITTKQVFDLGDTSGVLASNNSKKLAYFEKNKPQVLRIVTIDSDTPKVTEVPLPSGMIDTKATSSPTLHYWSKDSDTILASIKIGKTTQWLYIDTNTPKNSINISTTYDIAMKNVRFDPRTNTRLVALTTDGDVRAIDMGSGSLSAVLATNVSQMSFFGDKQLLYVYTNAEKKRALGYLTLGEKVGRDLPMIADSVEFIAGDTYFDNAYVAVATSSAVRVYRIQSLPDSTSTNTLSSSLLYSAQLSEAPLYMSVRNGGRFVVVQTKNGFNTYDIELNRYTAAKLGTPQTTELRWLDSYHVFYEGKNTLNVSEFDGSNSYQIEQANGWVAALTSSGKYLYSIAKTENGYSVQRSQMILD